MTLETVVINRSGTKLELKEGNNGVYRLLATLGDKDGKHVIICDQNATYREYWVGTGRLGDRADSITISSDDCAEYKTIFIVNDPADRTKFKLDMINRNVKVTAVVNQTGGDVNLFEKDGAEPHVIRKDEKFVIKSGPEEAKSYKVEADGVFLSISTKDVSKAQIINVNMTGQADNTVPRPTLDKVSRGLHVTQVTNKTSGLVKVKHRRGKGGSNESVDVATLMRDEKCTIQYDPKKGRNYWVEYYSCSVAGVASATEAQTLNIPPKDAARSKTIDEVEESAKAGPVASPSEAQTLNIPPKDAARSKTIDEVEESAKAGPVASPSEAQTLNIPPKDAARSKTIDEVEESAKAGPVASPSEAQTLNIPPKDAARSKTIDEVEESAKAGRVASPSKAQTLNISPMDFAEFERIDVVEDSAETKARLEKLDLRPEIATSKTNIWSRFLRSIGMK